MKKILRERGHGKTYDCIKLCIENDAILVTPYPLAYIEELAWREFGEQVRAIRFSEFIKLKGLKNEKLVFDGAIDCLKYFTQGNKIIGLSIEMGDD